MQKKLLAAIVVGWISTIGAVSCSSGSGSDSGGGSGGGTSNADCTRFCEKNNQCDPASSSQCMSLCSGIQMSSSCVDAVVAADCVEFNKDLSENPSWADACFPSCTNLGETTCNSGWATTCSDGRLVTLSCSFACGTKSMTYTGTCGPSYQGQTCTNGSSCCWCQ